MAARVPAEGVSPLAHDDRAEVAERQVPADRLPGHQLLLGAEGEAEARVDGRGRSRAHPDVREARRAAARAEGARRRRGRRDLRLGVGDDHLQEEARRGRRHLLLDVGSGARPPGPRPQIPRHRRPLRRQLLRRAQLGGLHRRLVLLHPEGREVPDGAVDLLPDQHPGLRAVRAHADHRRGRRVRLLSRGLYGAEVRHQPAARGGGGAGYARPRRDQVLDGAELVRRRRERRRRDLQLRHQARPVQGRRARRSRGPRSRPARRSRGNTRPVSCRARARSASSTPWR